MSDKYVNPANTSHRPDGVYSEVIDKIQQESVCPFCPDHLARYHEKPILEDRDYWLATENMYPYKGAENHLLFIHKDHIEDIAELDPEAWTELRALVMSICKARSIPGGTFMMRFGDTSRTGATVSHLHAQLISGSGEASADPIITRVG